MCDWRGARRVSGLHRLLRCVALWCVLLSPVTVPVTLYAQTTADWQTHVDRLRQEYHEVDSAFREARERVVSIPIDTIRVVMLSSDNDELFSAENRMSNNYVGGTVIRNGSEAYYDVDVRQVGSRFVRPNSGLKVRLNP